MGDFWNLDTWQTFNIVEISEIYKHVNPFGRVLRFVIWEYWGGLRDKEELGDFGDLVDLVDLEDIGKLGDSGHI